MVYNVLFKKYFTKNVLFKIYLFVSGTGNIVGTSQDSDGTSKARFVDMKATTGIQRPYFDDVGPRNVTAVVGQSALLNCRVKHPGDRTVSKLCNV